MIEEILLGIIQGITEWLPISSEGVIVLVKTNFFGHQSVVTSIKHALHLHLGTFLAALIYFRKDVVVLLKTCLNYSDANEETKQLFKFLLIATIISALLGILLLKLFALMEESLGAGGKKVNFAIGCLLLITAYTELKSKKDGYRFIRDLTVYDGILMGIVQGFAVLPGLSRSGLTVSALLASKLDKYDTLKISFLMSLPIVLGGNIGLILLVGMPPSISLAGLFFSFAFGLATIHGLLKLAQKINFGYFVLLFGLLMIGSYFI